MLIIYQANTKGLIILIDISNLIHLKVDLDS